MREMAEVVGKDGVRQQDPMPSSRLAGFTRWTSEVDTLQGLATPFSAARVRRRRQLDDLRTIRR